jgi:hypothetical protein
VNVIKGNAWWSKWVGSLHRYFAHSRNLLFNCFILGVNATEVRNKLMRQKVIFVKQRALVCFCSRSLRASLITVHILFFSCAAPCSTPLNLGN